MTKSGYLGLLTLFTVCSQFTEESPTFKSWIMPGTGIAALGIQCRTMRKHYKIKRDISRFN